MGEPTTNDMKIAQVVYNYLGLNTPEAVQAWIVKVTRVMSEGGEVQTVDGLRLIPLSPEVQQLQADIRTLARAIYDGLPLGDRIYRDGDEFNSGQKKALAILRIAQGKP